MSMEKFKVSINMKQFPYCQKLSLRQNTVLIYSRKCFNNNILYCA